MEGPYRDLGGGFVRLTGTEGARRAPSRMTSVEAALLELLRNSHEAGARNIYVASTLRRRRFRTLTVIDDGEGIPPEYADLIFEPGVTNRYLDSPGAGLSLYHLRDAALEARVASTSSPTAIQATFDTTVITERSLQSSSRRSGSNIRATLQTFLTSTPDPPTLYLSSPSRILATLLDKRIIQISEPLEVRERATELGLEVSSRTTRRILSGRVTPTNELSLQVEKIDRRKARDVGNTEDELGRVIWLGDSEEVEIQSILERVIRARYLEPGDIKVESKPGEVLVRISFYEPEDEYE